MKSTRTFDRDIAELDNGTRPDAIGVVVECRLNTPHGSVKTVSKGFTVQVLDVDDNPPESQEQELIIHLKSDVVMKVGLRTTASAMWRPFTKVLHFYMGVVVVRNEDLAFFECVIISFVPSIKSFLLQLRGQTFLFTVLWGILNLHLFRIARIHKNFNKF